MTHAANLRLGLIGDKIARSRSPILHRLAGAQNGMNVEYDKLIPAQLEQDFETVLQTCAQKGYRGINVTYPYKERAAEMVRINDPVVAAIGAVNTVLFGPEGPLGLNTDYSGFMAAYRHSRGTQPAGTCCLIGTGGVGRALAFGLAELGASELRLVDRDRAKAEALAADLLALKTTTRIAVYTDASAAAQGADGLLNGTPVGMEGQGGTPLPAASMTGAKWAFDAVYTPVETQFLTDASAAGLDVMSGYELFFFQGAHAWAHFSGKPLDQTALRAALQQESAP